MAKRPSIIETLTITPPADTATIVDIATRRSERADAVQHTSVYIPRPAYERLREIAFVERRKIHDLVMEGLDAVIAKRGHSETASRTKA